MFIQLFLADLLSQCSYYDPHLIEEDMGDTDNKSFAQDHIAQQWQSWVSELSKQSSFSFCALNQKHALLSLNKYIKTTE